MKRFAVLVALALTAFVASLTAGAPAGPKALRLLTWDNSRLVRLDVVALIEGVPTSELWDRNIALLLSSLDHDRNGSLDAKEASRIPPAFALRQMLWDQITPWQGEPPAMRDVDRDGDARVSVDELRSYYRRQGLGSIVAASATTSGGTALTEALLKALDRDKSGIVSEAEWKVAGESLRVLDVNDDELIRPNELMPRLISGASLAAKLVEPPVSNEPVSGGVLSLPADGEEGGWTKSLHLRFDADGDGSLDARESRLDRALFLKLDINNDGKLSEREWASLSATDVSTIQTLVRFPGNGAPTFALTSDSKSLELPLSGRMLLGLTGRLAFLRGDQGQLPAKATKDEARWQRRVAEADDNRDGALNASEVAGPKRADLKRLLDQADRNGDGALSAAELSEWLELQRCLRESQILLSLYEFDPGLFEWLDDDRDGALSVRELRSAWTRLTAAGIWTNDRLDTAKLPAHFVVVVSRGHPLAGPFHPRRDGPSWFQAMDRNHDGDVSPREFLGDPKDFRSLDGNSDSFIDAAEANRRKEGAGK